VVERAGAEACGDGHRKDSSSQPRSRTVRGEDQRDGEGKRDEKGGLMENTAELRLSETASHRGHFRTIAEPGISSGRRTEGAKPPDAVSKKQNRRCLRWSYGVTQLVLFPGGPVPMKAPAVAGAFA
jgi:hypothetical protein